MLELASESLIVVSVAVTVAVEITVTIVVVVVVVTFFVFVVHQPTNPGGGITRSSPDHH